MSFGPNKKLLARVDRAVTAVLQRQGHLTYPTLLCELGVLTRQDLDAWLAGRPACLETVIRANLTKLARIQTAVRRLARARGLGRTARQPPRGRRYSKTGHPFVEEEYATLYRPGQPCPRAVRNPLDGPRIAGEGGCGGTHGAG